MRTATGHRLRPDATRSAARPSIDGIPLSISPDGSRVLLLRQHRPGLTDLRRGIGPTPWARPSPWVRVTRAYVTAARPGRRTASRIALTTDDGIRLLDPADVAAGRALGRSQR